MVRCENCRWWDNSTQHRDHPDESGLCRINPPKVGRGGIARWPFTMDTDKCGYGILVTKDL